MATVAPSGPDLYAALGVEPAASGDEIARAFRARAKQLHPDASDDPDAAGHFRELVSAYDVLSNHRTRREYDDARRVAVARGGAPAPPTVGAVRARWTPRRAWTVLVAGLVVTVLGVGVGILTWRLHERDARLRARFLPVTATRVGNGDIEFHTAAGRAVRTREPEQHGEGTTAGPTVAVRYDPADPAHVVVDASSAGRDITLAIVAIKFLLCGPVLAVLGARRLRGLRAGAAPAAATGAR